MKNIFDNAEIFDYSEDDATQKETTMGAWSITTTFGRFMMTDIAIMDCAEGNGFEEGSEAFFEDAHRIFHRWATSGETQADYFGTTFFIMTDEDEAFIMEQVQ